MPKPLEIYRKTPFLVLAPNIDKKNVWSIQGAGIKNEIAATLIRKIILFQIYLNFSFSLAI